MRVRHILVSVATGDADVEAARLRAMSFRDSIAAGATFDDLARAYSDDTDSAPHGGPLGTYMLSALPPAFADEIRNMRLGDVSLPVKTQAGWHLLMLDDDRQALEEIVGQVLLKESFEKIIEETRERLYVEIRPQK